MPKQTKPTKPRAKLTDHERALLREMYESGLSSEQIAKKLETQRAEVMQQLGR